MFRNWLLRTTISIAAFTLIMAIFWGVQYSMNPHLLPSVTTCLTRYCCGVVLCGLFMRAWMLRKKNIR